MQCEPRVNGVIVVARVECAGPLGRPEAAARTIHLVRHPQPLPWDDDARRGHGNQRVSSYRQSRMDSRKRLDLPGAGLAESGHRAPPAAPARHPHGQVRERGDAIRTQYARRARREPQADVISNLGLWRRQRTQDIDRVRDRPIRSLMECCNRSARSMRWRSRASLMSYRRMPLMMPRADSPCART